MKNDQNSNDQDVLHACRQYTRQGQQYLANMSVGLPDANSITTVHCRHSSILEARSSGKDEFGMGGPFVAAKMLDTKAPDEERTERYFDPWYYNAMLLAELSGGVFCFDRSKRAHYYFLAFVRRSGSHGRHYLRRSIADTPPHHDTREISRSNDSHRNYRRATLKWTAKKSVRKLGQLTRSKSRTREDLIKFAVMLFEQRLQIDETAKRLGVNAQEYESLLREAFRVADAIHEALYGTTSPFAEAAE